MASYQVVLFTEGVVTLWKSLNFVNIDVLVFGIGVTVTVTAEGLFRLFV